VIQEWPDNGGLADYVDSAKMLEIFEATLAAHPDLDVVQVHYGFHQETAARYLPRFENGLNRILEYAESQHLVLVPRTFSGASPALVPRSRGACLTDAFHRALGR
jgi:hypothetical protein